MITHNVEHKSAREMLIPYVAISDNVNIQVGNIVVSSDFKELEVARIGHLHALSPDAANTISNLYKIDVMTYLKAWYKKYPHFNSLYLINLTLMPYVRTETLPVGSDKKD